MLAIVRVIFGLAPGVESKEGSRRHFMKGFVGLLAFSSGAVLLALSLIACGSVQEPSKAAPPASIESPAKAEAKTETKKTKVKAVEVEGVISSVGQRTITFQMERKGKVREEVVGVDEKTKIEKSGNSVKLRDLQATDKALINYEPEAYTPALAIKVVGKGEIKKVGGDD
jgi:hypothetical protein